MQFILYYFQLVIIKRKSSKRKNILWNVFVKSFLSSWCATKEVMKNVLVKCQVYLLNENQLLCQTSWIDLLYMYTCSEGTWLMSFSFVWKGVHFKLSVADLLVYFLYRYFILFEGKVIKFHIKSKWNVCLQTFYWFIFFFFY